MMNPDKFHNYDAYTWNWRWVGRNLGINRNITPADMDGFIHQNGELLLLEGKVTKQLPEISDPVRDMWRTMGNVTVLVIHTHRDDWDEETRQPERIAGYKLYPSEAFAASPMQYATCTYTPYPKADHDRETLTATSHLITVWSTWAALKDVANGTTSTSTLSRAI